MNIFDLLQSREQEESRARRINGVVVGIVTNNKDGLGRVRVKFQWHSQDYETDWVRIATLMAGSQRGSFFIPEVGDEVLLAFENGDFNSPYVVGCLWSIEDNPPTGNAGGENNIRMFQSRSGHKITFDDSAKEKKESLKIETNSGHSILLDDTLGSEKILIQDNSGNSIEIDSSPQNKISISSKLSLTLKATNIDIEAEGELKLSAVGTISINGTFVTIN